MTSTQAFKDLINGNCTAGWQCARLKIDVLRLISFSVIWLGGVLQSLCCGECLVVLREIQVIWFGLVLYDHPAEP